MPPLDGMLVAHPARLHMPPKQDSHSTPPRGQCTHAQHGAQHAQHVRSRNLTRKATTLGSRQARSSAISRTNASSWDWYRASPTNCNGESSSSGETCTLLGCENLQGLGSSKLMFRSSLVASTLCACLLPVLAKPAEAHRQHLDRHRLRPVAQRLVDLHTSGRPRGGHHDSFTQRSRSRSARS